MIHHYTLMFWAYCTLFRDVLRCLGYVYTLHIRIYNHIYLLYYIHILYYIIYIHMYR